MKGGREAAVIIQINAAGSRNFWWAYANDDEMANAKVTLAVLTCETERKRS